MVVSVDTCCSACKCQGYSVEDRKDVLNSWIETSNFQFPWETDQHHLMCWCMCDVSGNFSRGGSTGCRWRQEGNCFVKTVYILPFIANVCHPTVAEKALLLFSLILCYTLSKFVESHGSFFQNDIFLYFQPISNFTTCRLMMAGQIELQSIQASQ